MIAAVLVVVLLVAGAMPVAAADVTVDQKDRAFSTRALTIRPGDRITFVNGDDVAHNVHSATKNQEFDLKSQQPGQSNALPFLTAGTVDVQCAIHPKMKLQVTVAP